jgi:site-specific DNA recombinase
VNPREEWVTKEVPELRIIDQPLWDAVKARQTANAVEGDGIGMWDRRRPRHLLSGLMVCGECGGGYSKVAQSRFGCSSARNKGESVCRNKRTTTCDAVDNVVLHGLQEHLMAPELVALFCEEYLREVNRLRREAEASLDDMKIALAKVQREQARFIEAIREGAPAGPLAQPMALLEKEEQRLVEAIGDAKKPDPIRLHPGMAQIYRRRIADLVGALVEEDDSGTAREAIRSLIDRVVLTPDNAAKGGLRIDLEGELAGILALATDHKGVNGRSDLQRQVKMVAGTGFEPVTFRL